MPLLLLGLFTLSSCVGMRTRGSHPDTYQKRTEVVAAAQGLIGKNEIKFGETKYPYDCSGFVRAVYEQTLGVKLFKVTHSTKGKNGVELIFTYLQENGKLYKGGVPDEGDIVFFDKTYDLNKDGRLNDRLTHAGIVEKVDRHKTITFIHVTPDGIERAYINLAHPHTGVNPENKETYNTPVRQKFGKTKRKVLAGELFRAFGSVF